MNYNRYLDLHLCSSTFTAEDKQNPRYKFFTHRGTEYRYDFLEDMQRQGDYRGAKKEGYESGAWATLMSRANARVLDSSELTHSQKSFLQPTAEGISEELSRLRYVGCLVAIEHLRDPNNVYPQLQSLVRWISDPNTINKMRINCHGSGRSGGGFSMGKKKDELSPEDFVAALVRHGLSIGPKAVNIAGLAHAARWKRDNEVTECEGNCKKRFSFTERRHHCRRCGGIFCDGCSRWKVDLDIALAGESNKTVTNVKNARVCEECFKDASDHKLARAGGFANLFRGERALTDRETKYGLKQITLGLCLGAVSDDGFSLERGTLSTNTRAPAGLPGFVSGSLACRLIEALRQRGLRGIKVTASNQVVSGSTGCIQNELSVQFPRGTRLIRQPHGLAQVQRGLHDFGTRSDFDFPAKVWGESDGLRSLWDVCARSRPADLPNSSEISLHSANPRSLVFGGVGNDRSAFRFLKLQFFANWEFTGWVEKEEQSLSAPSSGARGNGVTIIVTPPDRVTKVEVRMENNQMRVFLTGRPAGEELFKWYKSYDES